MLNDDILIANWLAGHQCNVRHMLNEVQQCPKTNKIIWEDLNNPTGQW